MANIGPFDVLLGILYILLIFLVAFLYKERKIKKNKEYIWFIPGLALKVFGAVSFVLVYLYYFKIGDTFAYFISAKIMADFFWEDPYGYFQLMTSMGGMGETVKGYEYVVSRIYFFRSPEEYLMLKLTSIFLIISFNSYLIATILISVFSFFGLWSLFRLFGRRLGDYESAGISFFLIPSVVFWGSGLLKDTFTIGCMCYVIVFIYDIIERKSLIKSSIFLAINAYILFMLKGYILLSVLPAIFFMFFIKYKNSIRNRLLRVFVTPFVLVIFVFLGAYLISFISSKSERYSAKNLQQEVEGFQGWHETLSHQGQSGYSLGDIDFTTWGIIKKIPAAINVALFRPYLTEVNNIMMLLTSIESTIFLIISLYVLLRVGKRKILLYFKDNSELYMLFTFSLILSFATGFTSYNFGALARYKIPFMPFYLLLLLTLIKRYRSKYNPYALGSLTS